MKKGSTPTKYPRGIKSGSIIFARGVVYLVGIAAMAICFILLPELVREEGVGKPYNAFLTYSFFAAAYLIATPFFIALYQTLKLLQSIEKNKAFSNQTIHILQNIKKCAIVFNILIIIAVISGISLSRSVNPREDVTFMVTFGFIFTLVSSVIAIFVALLQKLLVEAISLKSENDLIV